MKLRIGIDFDNTIACYDDAFFKIASLQEDFDQSKRLSKAEIKKSILMRQDGHFLWQKLQGQVYGKYIHLATVFAGLFEFLHICRLRGNDVFIVSHKSEYGHYDEDKIPLRDVAIGWLNSKKLIGLEPPAFVKEEIFFESTREDKIDRIHQLGCTHFIDDLSEVLESGNFLENIEKILFDPSCTSTSQQSTFVVPSWQSITRHLFGEWRDDEICIAVQKKNPNLQIKKAELKKGRGNSRIYKLTGVNNKAFALKMYPDLQSDHRQRLETEYSACRALNELGLPVTNAHVFDEQLNWGIFDWVSGATIQLPDKYLIDEAIQFVQILQLKGRSSPIFESFPQASEACLTGVEIVNQITDRFQKLEKVSQLNLASILRGNFLPYLTLAVNKSRERLGNLFESVLPRASQILSPSDFGVHNILKNDLGQLVFIDFEYFGWDDPVKLACDFYWHPAMNLPENLKEYWINRVKKVFSVDPFFEERLEAYLPLFGLKWCLILLNEFLPERLIQRMRANNSLENPSSILELQLEKSEKLLSQVERRL